MNQSLLEMSVDLTATQIRKGQVDPRQAIPRLRENLQVLMHVNNTVVDHNGAETATPRLVYWRRSIRKHHIVCLECGLHARVLSSRHLATHGLTTKTYRARYNMPRSQGLTCKATSANRRAMTQQARPWEKSPTFVAAQKRAVAQQAMGQKRTRRNAQS